MRLVPAAAIEFTVDPSGKRDLVPNPRQLALPRVASHCIL